MAADYSNLSKDELIACIEEIEKQVGVLLSNEILPKIAALENKQLIKMYYQESFMEEFQRRYTEGQKRERKPSYKDIFYEMDETWHNATGQYRYSDYDSFYTVLKKWRKTHAKKIHQR